MAARGDSSLDDAMAECIKALVDQNETLMKYQIELSWEHPPPIEIHVDKVQADTMMSHKRKQ
jgi:hypothetical protein